MPADALAALTFLTRIPAGGGAALDSRTLARAAIWFPAVGVVVGGVVAGIRLLAGVVLPPEAATALALAAGVAVTGALHEDGLADTADALGAHTSRERRLEILRDPRVGTSGALAVTFAVLLAYALLAPLSGGEFARAAIAGHVLARWSPLPQSRLLPPARADGAGALLRAGTVATVAAGAFTAAAVVAVAGAGPGAVAIVLAVALTASGGLLARHVLGGTTGDTLGAVAKLVEVGTYAALVATW
jgi:adenosylcobinamide-GDP ribazoletransferase